MRFLHTVFWTVVGWLVLILMLKQPHTGPTNAELRVKYLNEVEKCERVARDYSDQTNPVMTHLCKDRAKREYEENWHAH